jgi:elongation factor Ts
MAISSEQVKQLRDLTGAGMMDCKRALEEADGDMERAKELLRTRGLAAAAKRAGRLAREGVVDAYIHMQGTLGVLIEVNCETDFVANTDDFRALTRDMAMHVAAAAPRWISRDDVPDDLVDGERKIFEEQAREDGKPDEIIPKIVEGKLEAFYKETCLLDQPWIRDDAKTIGDLIAETSAKVGEKIQVGRFARYRVGEAEDG